MFDFRHLLNQNDKHDVLYIVRGGADEVCVGFVKLLLVGVSEMWRRRDEAGFSESWNEQQDAAGRIIHCVELPSEAAQDVLQGLQHLLFTGQLPDGISWAALMSLIKLADEEMMPSVVATAAEALKQQHVIVDDSKVSSTITYIHSSIGHIEQLNRWLTPTVEQVASPIAADAAAMTALLQALPANSRAALGVLRAAWPKMPDGYLPCEFGADAPYHRAILRHHKVLVDNADRHFLLHVNSYFNSSMTSLMKDIAQRVFGPPAAALQSEAALRSFASLIESEPAPARPWEWYITTAHKDYLLLLHRVRPYLRNGANLSDHWQVATVLCSDPAVLSDLTAKEITQLLLPLLDERMVPGLRGLAVALLTAKQQQQQQVAGAEQQQRAAAEQQQRAAAEQQQQQQQQLAAPPPPGNRRRRRNNRRNNRGGQQWDAGL